MDGVERSIYNSRHGTAAALTPGQEVIGFLKKRLKTATESTRLVRCCKGVATFAQTRVCGYYFWDY